MEHNPERYRFPPFADLLSPNDTIIFVLYERKKKRKTHQYEGFIHRFSIKRLPLVCLHDETNRKTFFFACCIHS